MRAADFASCVSCQQCDACLHSTPVPASVGSISASLVCLEASCSRSVQPPAAERSCGFSLPSPPIFGPFFYLPCTLPALSCCHCLFLCPPTGIKLLSNLCRVFLMNPNRHFLPFTSPNPKLSLSNVCIFLFIFLWKEPVCTVLHDLTVKKANGEPCGGSSLLVLFSCTCCEVDRKKF